MNKFIRGIGSLLMSAGMALSVTSVYAEDTEENSKSLETKLGDTELTTYSGGGYTFEKISHADSGTYTNDGLVDYYEYVDDNGDYTNGVLEHTYTSADLEAMKEAHPEIDWDKIGIDELIGDGCQSYAYAAVGYKDWVYLGSMYGGIGIAASSYAGLVGNDSELADKLVDFLYNGEYYKEHVNSETGESAATNGVLIKLNVVTGETKILMAGSVTGEEPTMRGACEYNGKLYFLGAVLEHVDGEEGAGAGGLPSIYEVDPETDDVNCIYRAIDAAGYAAMVRKGVFPTLRTIIEYNGSLIASVTDENGAHLIAYTPSEDDFDEDGNFLGIYEEGDEIVRNAKFKEIADQKNELFDYPAYLITDSNYGGTIYQVIEWNDDLYVAINTGRSTLGTANEVEYDEETGTYTTTDVNTGCYRGWALVKGHYDETAGAVDDKSAWTWTSIIGNTADDQWDGDDGALYTFNVDPERYAPGTCTLEVYNGYLYIGDYDDVTLATFGALRGLGTNPECFRHLATNLKQSINLYRLDADMNIELVVGDATNMFPEGSITGLGAGYSKTNEDGTVDRSWGSHSNQYTAKAIVFDNDDTDSNDGTLFYSTLDEGTILTPFAQIMNSELLNMSAEEWETKLNRLKVFIELYSEKNQAESEEIIAEASYQAEVTESAGDEEEITAEDALTADNEVENGVGGVEIDEAIADAIIANAIDEAEVTLSNEEREEIVQDIVSGVVEIVDDALDAAEEKAVEEIKDGLEKMQDLLETTDVAQFAEIYGGVVDEYNDIKDNLPESITESLDEYLNEDYYTMMKDLLTILNYLKDATRGCDVYAITTADDGSDLEITCVTNNGMGDFNNHTMRNFAITDDYLLFCTGNPVRGSQIWRMVEDPDGNTYSHETHHFDTVIDQKDPTETEDGYITYECTECDETYTEVIPATGTKDPDEGTTPSEDPEDPADQPEETKKKESSGIDTGDSFNAGILGGTFAACAALAAAVLFVLKKDRD